MCNMPNDYIAGTLPTSVCIFQEWPWVWVGMRLQPQITFYNVLFWEHKKKFYGLFWYLAYKIFWTTKEYVNEYKRWSFLRLYLVHTRFVHLFVDFRLDFSQNPILIFPWNLTISINVVSKQEKDCDCMIVNTSLLACISNSVTLFCSTCCLKPYFCCFKLA